jgi:hypothetical protein
MGLAREADRVDKAAIQRSPLRRESEATMVSAICNRVDGTIGRIA